MITIVSRLPEIYSALYPFINVLPAVPVVIFLLAFAWQASVGFR